MCVCEFEKENSNSSQSQSYASAIDVNKLWNPALFFHKKLKHCERGSLEAGFIIQGNAIPRNVGLFDELLSYINRISFKR